MSQLDPVYFALDFKNGEEALQFLRENELDGIPVKVGMELFYQEGPGILSQLKEKGHRIFLDLKLHDIPETVKCAMRNLAKLQVDVVNVHAQGGTRMMEAARTGLEEGTTDKRPLLFAVTVLTSTDQQMLENEWLLDMPLQQVVSHYSRLTEVSGLDGVVCSVHEAKIIKTHTNLRTLTPGIRRNDGDAHDQKRIATPETAKEQGSDSIVVGRAIREAENPRAAYQLIKEEFENEIHHS